MEVYACKNICVLIIVIFIYFRSKSGHLKTTFQNETVAVNADMDLDRNGPLIQASAVVGYQGWLAGYQTAFDTQNKKLTKNNFALGFSTGDLILHTNV